MKYTIDNPKLVKYFRTPEENNLTGFVKDKDYNMAFYENGLFHRTDGPALIYFNGTKEWYIHGKRHREDGPAIILGNGSKTWCYNDKVYGANNDFTTESWIKKWKLEIFI